MSVGATNFMRFLMDWNAEPLRGEHGNTVSSGIPFFLYTAEQRDEFVLYKSLGYVVKRAEFHALHSSVHFGVVGHDDERLHHPFLAHPA